MHRRKFGKATGSLRDALALTFSHKYTYLYVICVLILLFNHFTKPNLINELTCLVVWLKMKTVCSFWMVNLHWILSIGRFRWFLFFFVSVHRFQTTILSMYMASFNVYHFNWFLFFFFFFAWISMVKTVWAYPLNHWMFVFRSTRSHQYSTLRMPIQTTHKQFSFHSVDVIITLSSIECWAVFFLFRSSFWSY